MLFILSLLVSCAAARLNGYEDEINCFRKKYKNDFLIEERSPLSKKDLRFLDFYKPDSNYKITAHYVLLENPDTLDFKTSAGKIKQFLPYARMNFEIEKVSCSLTVFKSMQLAGDVKYADYLFLPFTDATNSSETYGGGRYIDMDMKDFDDGIVKIDFNKAYNPYCAFATGYNCPVPPKENDLNIEIRAGEKRFKKEKKH